MTTHQIEREIAKKLKRENLDKHRSWRTISKEDYEGKVNPTTLCRIANSHGRWFPHLPEIRIALDAPIEECHICHQRIAPKEKKPRIKRIPKYGSYLFNQPKWLLSYMLKNREPMP